MGKIEPYPALVAIAANLNRFQLDSAFVFQRMSQGMFVLEVCGYAVMNACAVFFKTPWPTADTTVTFIIAIGMCIGIMLMTEATIATGRHAEVMKAIETLKKPDKPPADPV